MQVKEVVLPFIARFAWKFQTIGIRIRHANKFRLTAVVRAGTSATLSGGNAVRIRPQARVCKTTMTIEAVTAGDVERQSNAIAFFDADNGFSDSSMSPMIS